MEKRKRFTLAVVLRVMFNAARYVTVISGFFVFIVMAIALFTPLLDDYPRPLPIPIEFEIDFTHHQIHSATLGIDQGKIEAASGFLIVPYSSRGWIAVGMLFVIVVFGSTWIVLHNLWRIMQTAANGLPFVRENSRRLRYIGFAIIASKMLQDLGIYYARQWVAAKITLNDINLKSGFDLSVDAILLGILILVFAEIFRRGTALEEDQSLTV